MTQEDGSTSAKEALYRYESVDVPSFAQALSAVPIRNWIFEYGRVSTEMFNLSANQTTYATILFTDQGPIEIAVTRRVFDKMYNHTISQFEGIVLPDFMIVVRKKVREGERYTVQERDGTMYETAHFLRPTDQPAAIEDLYRSIEARFRKHESYQNQANKSVDIYDVINAAINQLSAKPRIRERRFKLPPHVNRGDDGE